MPTVDDWAAKAARYIKGCDVNGLSTARIAAAIATFAEPLMKLARDSRRDHYHCDDG